MPLSLIANALPKALKSLDIIQSSKGWLSIILNTCLTFRLIKVIDTFMDTISITWQGALLFALVTALISWKLGEKDNEPPMIDSGEFEQLEKRFHSKKYPHHLTIAIRLETNIFLYVTQALKFALCGIIMAH